MKLDLTSENRAVHGKSRKKLEFNKLLEFWACLLEAGYCRVAKILAKIQFNRKQPVTSGDLFPWFSPWISLAASHLHVQEFDSLNIRSTSDHLPLGIANELDHILSWPTGKFQQGGSDRVRSLETRSV